MDRLLHAVGGNDASESAVALESAPSASEFGSPPPTPLETLDGFLLVHNRGVALAAVPIFFALLFLVSPPDRLFRWDLPATHDPSPHAIKFSNSRYITDIDGKIVREIVFIHVREGEVPDVQEIRSRPKDGRRVEIVDQFGRVY